MARLAVECIKCLYFFDTQRQELKNVMIEHDLKCTRGEDVFGDGFCTQFKEKDENMPNTLKRKTDMKCYYCRLTKRAEMLLAS